jgi:hypothetical protein
LGEDLHGELGIDALLADQLVQGIRQGDAETVGTGTKLAQGPLLEMRAHRASLRKADLPSMTIQIVIVICRARHFA